MAAGLAFGLTGDALRAHWNLAPAIVAQGVDTTPFPSPDFIWERLEAGLLRWPYFALVKEGKAPDKSLYTVQRDVIGKLIPGFPRPGALRRFVQDGASLKLNQMEDWAPSVRDVARQLTEFFSATVTGYVFLTPEGDQGMAPHRDAAHVFALQLDGSKSWWVSREGRDARAGLDASMMETAERIDTHPGDLLYIPHGCPHMARALDGVSTHLTFTVAEPTPLDLVEELAARFDTSAPPDLHTHHLLTLERKAERVGEHLSELVSSVDPCDLNLAALRRAAQQ